MTTPVFEAKFVGLHIKIIERKGNPCTNPALQEHYDYGYFLATFTTTSENPSIYPGRYTAKLVRTKLSWNPEIRKQHDSNACLVIQHKDEVIADVEYTITRHNKQDVDMITFVFRSTKDFCRRQSVVVIPHNADSFLVSTTHG